MALIYPDTDELLVTALQAQFPTARVCTELPADLEQHLPAIQVNRLGGNSAVLTMDRPYCDVDCWAASHDAASLLSSQVRSWILLGLVGHRIVGVTGTGVFSKVQEQTGAMRRPSGNPDVWRMGMVFTISVHATS